jgi:hypothetical protein
MSEDSSEGKEMEKPSLNIDETRRRKRLHHEIRLNQLTPQQGSYSGSKPESCHGKG